MDREGMRGREVHLRDFVMNDDMRFRVCMAFTSFEMMDGRWMADSGVEGLTVRVNVDRVESN
jgi:hypothetical protein